MLRLRTFMAVLGLLSALGAATPGCSNQQYVVVTVTLTPGAAPLSVAMLRTTFTNGVLSSTVDVANDDGSPVTFPTNFSGSIPGRSTGIIDVSIDALDSAGTPVASGTGSETLSPTGQTPVNVVLFPRVCGDGDVTPGEECDDGNTTAGDGCDAFCQLEGECGNGMMELGEECDDGNVMPGDGCDANCQLEGGPGCGDGVLDTGEECDDGNASDADDCPTTCENAFCGDGFVWTEGAALEECDDTDPTSNADGCFADCTRAGPAPAVGFLDGGFASATLHGGSPSDALGARFMSQTPLASGDFNDDGIEDLLVGAPLADGPGDARPDGGEAYVVFGGNHAPGAEFDAAGTDFTDVDVRLYGRAAGVFFGASVAAADVDGDGIDDIVVTAPFADPPSAAGGPRTDAGEAYVVLGSSALGGDIDTNVVVPFLTVRGAEPFDALGSSIAAGDIDGDGSADLLIGIPGGDGPANGRSEAGEAAVILSSTGLYDLLTMPGHSMLLGAEANDAFGTDVDVGDFDGDGSTDLFVSARFADGPMNSLPEGGEVYVFRGAALLPATQDTAMIAHEVLLVGNNFDTLAALEVADLNGDGLDDLLAGGTGNTGRVVGILGRSLPPTLLTLQVALAQVELDFTGTFDPMSGSSSLGSDVTTADIDADGALDVVTGASNWIGPGDIRGGIFGVLSPPLTLGVVTPYSLDPLSPAPGPDVTILHPESLDVQLGVAGLGDFNNDGLADVAFAGPLLSAGLGGTRSDAGRVFVYYAGPGPLVPPAACFNGLDDDGDGSTDLDDPGCGSIDDASELLGSACDDGADNDGDGVTDFPLEPGCETLGDDDETDPPLPPACANGADDDGDGLIDFLIDPGCYASGDAAEDDCTWSFTGGSAMGWTFSNSCTAVPTGPVGWQLDTFRSVSPFHSLYYGNPVDRNFDCAGMPNNGTATSLPIVMPVGGATVSFFFFGDSEGCSPSGGFDIVTLRAVDPGGVQTTLWSRCDQSETASGTGGMFVLQEVDLSAFAGMTIQLQFHQDTGDGIGNEGEGFYVDDIFVTAACP